MNGLQQHASTFVRHEPCPRCGSKDNLGRYSNGGGYCFGCGYMERSREIGLAAKDSLHRVSQLSRDVRSSSEAAVWVHDSNAVRPPPDDCSNHYGQAALKWLEKYDIGVVDLIKHNVVWSPSREQLIYQFFGEGTDLVLWQARNFREGTTHKDRFYTGGKPETVVAYYRPEEETRTGAIVEDCVSGIKCARAGVAGIPCFGSTMSKQKLLNLSRVFSHITVWLDSDKQTEAKKMATILSMLGVKAKLAHTAKDPKEYSEKDIGVYTYG